ncbi:hypothetical protein JT358_08270 [Micrococcales bacterium 31B]|nr:hypothetical protein [Micrococcales bacterium 31B]
MYAALWRVLPGHWFLKVLILLALAFGVVVLCFNYVFPAIAPFVPFNNEATVGS